MENISDLNEHILKVYNFRLYLVINARVMLLI